MTTFVFHFWPQLSNIWNKCSKGQIANCLQKNYGGKTWNFPSKLPFVLFWWIWLLSVGIAQRTDASTEYTGSQFCIKILPSLSYFCTNEIKITILCWASDLSDQMNEGHDGDGLEDGGHRLRDSSQDRRQRHPCSQSQTRAQPSQPITSETVLFIITWEVEWPLARG